MENREQTLEGRLLLWASDWLTAALLSAGMVFPCLSAYGISGQYGFDLGAVLAFCLFGSLAATAIFTWKRGYWAALAVLAAGGLIFWRLWVHMAEEWRLVRDPGLADLLDASPGALFLLYALVVLTLGWVVVRVRTWWLAAALALLPVLPAIQAGILPAWPAMLAGAIGWGSMLLTGLFDRSDRDGLGRARLLSLTGMTALVVLLTACLPRGTYTRPQWATDARQELLLAMNRQLSRFFDMEELEGGLLAQLGLDLSVNTGTGPGTGPGQGPGFTEASGTGLERREDLQNLGPRRYADRLLLRLDTDQPDPAGRMYLRGASFGTYTGVSWESANNDATGLNPEWFPPLTVPDAPVYTMHIRDAGFWGTWYYPYRYAGNRQLDADGRLTLEQSLDFLEYPDRVESLGDMPSEEYYIPYLPGGPEDGFVPLNDGWVDQEEWYRTFLRSYLEVPDTLRTVLEPLLEEIGQEAAAADDRLPEQFRAPVAAAARTASWLAAAAHYDPDTPAMGEAEDFVAHFLTEKRGFCVHFATAGTMLLRMQGIPARYVNGYVATLNNQGWGTVLDSDSHAWVEIYLDGYGWYPVEMTPGYTGGTSGVDLEGAVGEPEPDEPEPEDPEEDLPEEEDPEEQPPEEETPDGQDPEEAGEEDVSEAEGIAVFWKILFGIAVFWAILCAAYLLGLLARSQARKDGDTNRSALNAYGRYKRLRRWGCGEDGELERLAKKAKFSQHTLTEEERESAWKCLDENVKESRVGQPIRRRWLFALLYPIF